MNLASQLDLILANNLAVFLIAVIGLVLALVKRPRSRGLVIIAMILLLARVLLDVLWRLIVFPGLASETIGSEFVDYIGWSYNVVYQILLAASWVLVFIALFRRGAPDPAPSQHGSGGQPWDYGQPGAQPGQHYGPPQGSGQGSGQQYGPGHGPAPAQQYGPHPGTGQDYGPGPSPGPGPGRP